MNKRMAKRGSRGYWYREGLMNMRAGNIGQQGELLDVLQFWYDGENRLVRTVTAERALYQPGDDGHWLLQEVRETRFAELENVTRTLPTLRWDGQVDPRLLTVRVLVEPRKLSLEDLYRQIEYMERERLNTNIYELAFWTKILQPLSVLGLALLALGFILGPLREVGMGVRLSIGVFAGLGFKYAQDLFAPMSMVYDLPAPVAVALPIAVCWVLGTWGLTRLR
jgi:lipopolysaccharide export system permease protein